MSIEQVLRKIVEKAMREHTRVVWEAPPDSIHRASADAIVHALLNSEEVVIKGRKPVQYGCYCDLEPHQKPDGCVIDEGKPYDCVYARDYLKKEDCEYWKPIKED